MYSQQYNIKQSYQNHPTLFSSQQKKINSLQQIQTISQLKDTIISMQYRIKIIQQQINSKMQRQQCLMLMQRKSNSNHVKKSIDEIYHKIQTQKLLQQKQRQKLAQQQQNKINQMKKKLKNINNPKNITQLTTSPTNNNKSNILFTSNNTTIQLQKITQKINKVLIQPQQLYLQSNQTMFSMLIDQIKQLKSRDNLIERLIQNKHKKTVSLNNQVCRKLQFLQSSIEETIKYIDQIHNNWKETNNNASMNENKVKKTKKNASTSVKNIHQNSNINNNTYNSQISNNIIQKQKVFSTLSNPNQAFQSIRIQLLSKSVQSLQRQLSTKINIKDLVPLIKQNILPYDESINEIRQYIEQNFESTRKILTNQSQINQQISNANKLGWWHLYQREDNYLVFNREIMNIIPEVLVVQNSNRDNNNVVLKIINQGWYLIQCYNIQHDVQNSQDNSNSNRNYIRNNNINMINNINQYQQKSSRTISHIQMQVNQTLRYTIVKEKLINFTAGTQIRFLANVQDLFLKIQKL